MTPYQKHKAQWKDCSRCSLGSQRCKVVLASGKIPCDILFIGEAPGISEDTIGKPFVGPAGRLLRKMIANGLSPKTRYCLTNLVACYPREAKEQGINEPPDECICACRKRLREFVRLCKPRGIVLVGKLAAKHVSGRPMEFVEILHPAAILRMDPSQQPLAIRRCILAIQEIEYQISE